MEHKTTGESSLVVEAEQPSSLSITRATDFDKGNVDQTGHEEEESKERHPAITTTKAPRSDLEAHTGRPCRAEGNAPASTCSFRFNPPLTLTVTLLSKIRKI